MKYDYALFDLDGTISKSAAGVTRCVQYALGLLGIEEPDIENLNSFVGPPLNVEFKRRYALTPEQIEFAVLKYRERYSSKGIFECSMYPGIHRMLRDCFDAGIIMAVTSSKPEPYVLKVLEYFGIREYFDVVVGSNPDDEINSAGADQKHYLVKKTIELLQSAGLGRGLTAENFGGRCAMVGDRSFDMNGAKANAVHPVGVSYGYGSMEELREAGAEYIAGNAEELAEILLG